MSNTVVVGVVVALCHVRVMEDGRKKLWVYLVEELSAKEAIGKEQGMHTIPIEMMEGYEGTEDTYRRTIVEKLCADGLPYDIKSIGACEILYPNGMVGVSHLGVARLPEGSVFISNPKNKEEVRGIGWVDVARLAKVCEAREYRIEMRVIVPALVEYFRKEGVVV